MGPILLGDKGYEINAIALAITNSVTAASVLREWTRLSYSLGIVNRKTEQLRLDFLHNKISFDNLISNVLMEWRQSESHNATFNKLLYVLDNKCGWKDTADTLWDEFHTKLPSGTTWQDLHAKIQKSIQQTIVNFFGKEFTLQGLLKNADEILKQSFYENLDSTMLYELLTKEPLQLCESSLPEKPLYYISRLLNVKRRVRKELFSQTTSDKFVIYGLTLTELSDLASSEPVDLSWPPKRQYLARFIHLVNRGDFDFVCKAVKNVPVHLIHYEAGKFYWKRSQGNMTSIRSYLHAEPELTHETSILALAQQGSPQGAVVIADCPGMGKSELLGNLCRAEDSKSSGELRSCNVFVCMAVFMSKFLNYNKVCWNDVKHELPQYVNCNFLGERIFKALLDTNSLRKNFFLDGFDEIVPQQQSLALDIVKLLSANANTQVIISTRTNDQHHLESHLNCIAYNIWPLKMQQMTNLITEYWRDVHRVRVTNILQELAQKIVEAGIRSVDKREFQFAGVPLQCRLLAEIYADDAKTYSNMESDINEVHVELLSIFDLFEKIIDLKFKRVPQESREAVMQWHTKMSLQHIFPVYTETIENILETTEFDSVFSYINAVGIVTWQKENAGQETTCVGSNKVSFIHRSFAEFLVTKFLLSPVSPSNNIGQLKLAILFKNVLEVGYANEEEVFIGVKGIQIERIYEHILSHSTTDACRARWKDIMFALNSGQERVDYVQAVWNHLSESKAAIENNHMHDILYCVLFYGMDQDKQFALPLSHFVDSLRQCNLQDLAESLQRRYTKRHFSQSVISFLMDLGVTKGLSSLSDSNCYGTGNSIPTRASLVEILETCMQCNYMGLFDLLQNCRFNSQHLTKVLTLDNWCHVLNQACHHSSLELTAAVCEMLQVSQFGDIASINKYLTSQNSKSYLQVVAERGSFPLFDYFYKMLHPNDEDLHLIIHSCVDNTLYLSNSVISEKIQIIKFLLNRHRSLIYDTCINGGSPLHKDNIHTDILKQLISEDYDVNKNDKFGENVAHKAGRYLAGIQFHSFVQLLTETNNKQVLFVKNRRLLTPIHYVLEHNKLQEITIRMLVNEGLLKSTQDASYLVCAIRGGQTRLLLEELVNAGADPRCILPDGCSILHMATMYGFIDGLKYFIFLGVDINGRDNQNRTPLHCAFTFLNKNIHSTVDILVKNGADLYAKDDAGRTPIWYCREGEGRQFVQDRTIQYLNKALNRLQI